MHGLWFIILVVGVAFVFDFINGFHDASNSIATIVSTGVLKPTTAVAWAAFFNFIAFLFFHLKIANTIGTGLVSTDIIDSYIILSALIGAISFNLLTWWLGLPSSSSHALIGGLVGAAVTRGGWHVLNFAGIAKVVISILLSPLMGFLIAFIAMKCLLAWLAERAESDHMQRIAKYCQLTSSALLSLGHGGNDAQKTMGIIAVVLFSANLLGPTFYIPVWVMVSCNLVMSLGTLLGGWRIVNTLGKKITELKPLSGSCAETGAACTLFLANHLGIPVSTTHTVTGAITGVGTARTLRSADWGILQRIFWAWAFTIPCAAIIASLMVKIHFWLA